MAENEEFGLTFCVYLNEDYYNHLKRLEFEYIFFLLCLRNVEVIKISLNGTKAL